MGDKGSKDKGRKEQIATRNTVLVGRLPLSASAEQLKQIFSTFGTVVRAEVRTNGSTGSSEGFGLVQMSSESEADQAREQANGSNLGGSILTVIKAEPRQKQAPRLVAVSVG